MDHPPALPPPSSPPLTVACSFQGGPGVMPACIADHSAVAFGVTLTGNSPFVPVDASTLCLTTRYRFADPAGRISEADAILTTPLRWRLLPQAREPDWNVGRMGPFVLALRIVAATDPDPDC